MSHTTVYWFFWGLECRGCSIGSYTYWSWRSITKRAWPKVMIIYKYQYEKECVLKKTHCYWCLNNCSVREMERGGKMRIIFSHCVLWGGKKKKKKKAVNRTHLTRLKQWSQGQDKNSTSLSLPLFLCLADKTTNKYIIRQFAGFFAASRIICRCCRSLSVKRQRRECLTMQTLMIKTGKSVCLQKWFFFFFSLLLLCVSFNLSGQTQLYLHFKYSYLKRVV